MISTPVLDMDTLIVYADSKLIIVLNINYSAMIGNSIGLSISLPKELVQLIEAVRTERQDPTRSDTIRVLLLEALASKSYLTPPQKKALGVRG